MTTTETTCPEWCTLPAGPEDAYVRVDLSATDDALSPAEAHQMAAALVAAADLLDGGWTHTARVIASES